MIRRRDARNLAPALSRLNANFKDGIVIGFNPPPSRHQRPPAASSAFRPGRVGWPAQRPVGGGQQGGAGGHSAAPKLRGVSTTSPPPCRSIAPMSIREKARALGIPINNHLRDHAELVRQGLYVNDFSLTADLSRQPVLGGRFPREAGRTCATSSCAPTPCHGAAERTGELHAHTGPDNGRSLQHASRGQNPRQSRAGLFVGPGDRPPCSRSCPTLGSDFRSAGPESPTGTATAGSGSLARLRLVHGVS